MRQLPHVLTASRIALTPVVVALLFVPALWAQAAAVVCFMLASASDYFDGEIARRWQVRSRLGQFLDPLADKFLVLGTFVALALAEPQAAPWWAIALIAGRDVAVTALRSWAESTGRTLRTLRIAKSKTLLQIAYLWFVLTLRAFAWSDGALALAADRVLHSPVPLVLLVAVVAVTLVTGAAYFLSPQEETTLTE
jgi:CDP-diacylglycerol--glycerol-3-phosphate 3-phosphatidyltransferase